MNNEELAAKIQNGESDLTAVLWLNNQGLIYQMCYKLYARYRDKCASAGVEIDDIVQSAYFAICQAAQEFKPDGEFKFSSYIKFHLLHEFNKLIGIRKKRPDALNQALSLDAQIGDDDGDATFLDTIADPNAQNDFAVCEDGIYNDELRGALKQGLNRLTKSQEKIIIRRYFDGEKQGDIARSLGVTQERVHKLEREALRKLRRIEKIKAFREDIISRLALKHTGFTWFKEHQMSSVENAVIKAEKFTDKRRQARFRD